MPVIHRRTFIERLGLGAGAALLTPALGRFVRDARAAAAPTRPRLVVMVQSNGMNFNQFAPPGHKPADTEKNGGDKKLYIANKVDALPPMFAALQPYQQHVTLVDGLSSQVVQRNHGVGHCALSCVTGVGNSSLGPPGGPTFDQVIARSAVGRGTVFPSILLGPRDHNDRPLMNTVFASGRGKFAPQHAHATAAYQHAFGNLVGGAGAGPVPYDRRKKLLDHLRVDAQRTRAALAGPEQAKLDQMLGSMEALDLRMIEFARMNAELRGKVTLAPITREPATIEERCRANMQIATSALTAGLTNVLGFSATATGDGIVYKELGLRYSTHDHGHGGESYAAPLDKVSNFYAGLLVTLMKGLEATPEGAGTMLDNTIIVWLSDQAEQHHPWLYRWPTVLIAGRNTGLPTGLGLRYVRYPVSKYVHTEVRSPSKESVARNRAPGGRCMADLFITLSHALGVPDDSFGKEGSYEQVQGVLPDLLT